MMSIIHKTKDWKKFESLLTEAITDPNLREEAVKKFNEEVSYTHMLHNICDFWFNDLSPSKHKVE